MLLLIAFALRVWDLDIKPPHFDEGINGNFVAGMWRDGFYRYDPSNFHGPLYFYVLQIAELLFGRSIVVYRFVTGLISVALVAAIAQHRRFFGNAALWAAAVVAVSPAFVFYSRYAIHETLFVFLQVLFSYGFFSWRERRSRRAMALMVAGVFGTFTVKETFFIFFGTWAIAAGCVALADRWFPIKAGTEPEAHDDEPLRRARRAKSEKGAEGASKLDMNSSKRGSESSLFFRRDIWAIVMIGAFLTAVLFSGFFMNMKGLGDMFAAFSFWTKTGTGPTGHEKAFHYWLQLLLRYEVPELLGLVLSPLVFFVVDRNARLVLMTAFGTFLAYSIIPYKTPWLIMNMLWLLAFSLGFAINRAKEIDRLKWVALFRPALGAAVLMGVVYSTYTMFRLNFRDFTNPKEPYVYVQSTLEFKEVMDVIEARVKARPEDLNMRLRVLSSDPWPMPWTLGEFPNLQWGKAESADLTDADVVLVDASKRAVLEPRLQGKYWVRPFQIRDAYEKGFAFLSFEKFKGLVPSDSEVFERGTGGGQ